MTSFMLFILDVDKQFYKIKKKNISMANQDVLPTDVIKVLECNLTLLEVTLLGEDIGPSAVMEIEQNVCMIKAMIERLKKLGDKPFTSSSKNTPNKTSVKEKPKTSFKNKEKGSSSTKATNLKTDAKDKRASIKLGKEQLDSVSLSPVTQHVVGNEKIEAKKPLSNVTAQLPSKNVVVEEETYEVNDDGRSLGNKVGGDVIVNEETYEVTDTEPGNKVDLSVTMEEETYEVTDEKQGSGDKVGHSLGSNNGVIVDEDTYEVTDESRSTVQKVVVNDIADEDTYEITNEMNSKEDSISASISDHSMTASVTSSDDDLKSKIKYYQSLPFEQLKEQATCASYLQKHKKGRLLSQWHKRYCMLVDCFIFYYKSESSSKDKGVINLNAQKVDIPPKDKSFTINLDSIDKAGDSYTLQADTTEDYEKWKLHLNNFDASTKSLKSDNDVKEVRSISMVTEDTATASQDSINVTDEQVYEGEDNATTSQENSNEMKSNEDLSIDNIYMGLYDCTADNSDELSFKSGDVLYILDRVNKDWWLGCLNGRCGYVPSIYMTTPFLSA